MAPTEPPTVTELGEKGSEAVSSLNIATQQSDDPQLFQNLKMEDGGNPRSWPVWKKRLVFAALISSSFLADGAMTWGATLVVNQAVAWDISPAKSATSLNYGILLQGFGGIFAVPLIESYGRLPVWFWSQVLTFFMVLGATLSNDWDTFTVFRSLQGFFGTVPQVVGLPVIYDMYEPEDWPKMINIWGTTFLIGPFLGPALAGYILSGSTWEVSFGTLTALYGLSTLLIILFGYETHHRTGNNNNSSLRLRSFFGVGNVLVPKTETLLAQSRDILRMMFKIPLLLTGVSTMINFCWPIGITTTIDTFLHAPPYLFSDVQAASMRFAGVIGGLCGYIFGYFFNIWIRRAFSHCWRPEYRLHGVWFPIGSMACGLVTYGLTLNAGELWVGLAFGWIMVNLGMIGSTVAITSYALEKFPSQATIVSAIINMWRTCGGFSVAYFQPSWIERDGVAVVFGVQAAVVAAGVLVTILPVYIREGRRHERKSDGDEVHQSQGQGEEGRSNQA